MGPARSADGSLNDSPEEQIAVSLKGYEKFGTFKI